MTFKTRGSVALDKAQRRLALLKSIDEDLDMGYGLSVETYNTLIEHTRVALEHYNTLRSNLEESRKVVTELDASLSALSARMLTGVAARYGKDSMQYVKAGGSNSKRGKTSAAQTSTPAPTPPETAPAVA